MKALLAGWFSFEQMGASAGDLLARDVVRDWLDGAGVAYDVALAPPFAGGVDWRSVDADDYTHVVFVCGPVGNGEPLAGLLERFRGRRLVGVDVTMLDDLERWNPFDVLLERDSSRTTRPDLAFLAPPRRVPVVGVVLIDAQPEYGDGDLHEPADAAIERVLAAREVVTIRVDTRLDTNDQTAAEVESLIARTDAVLTTRLHGLVLALKNGVPAVAIDTVAGGSKVSRQAAVLGWPVLRAETLDDAELAAALDRALTDDARAAARASAEGAARLLASVRDEFLSALT